MTGDALILRLLNIGVRKILTSVWYQTDVACSACYKGLMFDIDHLDIQLPTEGDAIDVAKLLATKLAETSKVGHGTFIVVTDMYGTQICKIPVPSSQ